MDLSNISLASLSFDSSTCVDIICGSNGLPLTPNSIKIIGDFKAQVEHVEHPNLVKYVECFRNKNERVTLVFEHIPPQPCELKKASDILELTSQLLDALSYLHRTMNCVHGLINPGAFRWSGSEFKLTDWPIHLLTNGGLSLGAATILPKDVSYIAPEQVKCPQRQATPSSDIWSAGLTLLKLLKPTCKIPENPCRLAFCDTPKQVLDILEGDLGDLMLDDSSRWTEFFMRALHPDPNLRGRLDELYRILQLDRTSPTLVNQFDPSETKQSEVTQLNISEIYYLWRLSIGRNLESEQKQDDFPPIFKIPYLIVTEKQLSSSSDSKLKSHIIIDTRPKPIPLDKFKADVLGLDTKIFHPLVSNEDHDSADTLDLKSASSGDATNAGNECNNGHKNITRSFTFADLDNLSLKSSITNQIGVSSKVLPLVIKEADFAYQCERIILFKQLLAGCPFLEEQLRREASIDIPPYYRAQIWAILLQVSSSKNESIYESIDKTTPVATDRQISVDIPRCHQYNELMASPKGHEKLARILKAWLNYNSAEYVYWQGLDSLAAPFLLLNFDNEALAFACFNAFISKYLRGFFRKDNQLIVQQYLSMFAELLSYHDPSLADHLERLNFLPNLYAIPWFLTMFTHVLPLHKVLHVWDCLLLGDERFPLCIGLAILNQLRPQLMDYTFNDCIVIFSDLPEIDIERCIRDASHYYNSTPDKLIKLSEIRDYQDQSWLN